MVCNRRDQAASNSVHHFAFRVAEFASVTSLAGTLNGIEGIKVSPLSHGNTLSIYFNDPEGNGIEVFWDTPWHVPQPQGKPWDTSLSEASALDWVESSFADEKGFVPREDYYEPRRQGILE
jgi:catechol-2,3-dioxygenase